MKDPAGVRKLFCVQGGEGGEGPQYSRTGCKIVYYECPKCH